MELDPRSRIWIVTFFFRGEITDGDLPDIPCTMMHAKTSDQQDSASVFIKFETLKSASWVTNWFTKEHLVIKRGSWKDYELFSNIPFTSEVKRDQNVDHGATTSPGDHTTADELKRSYSDQDGGCSDSSDDFIHDVKRIRTIYKRIRKLDVELGKLKTKHRAVFAKLLTG